MLGILRVVPPSEGSAKSHRVLLMRRAPSQAQLEDIVGGKLLLIPDFDTILNEGASEPCIAFRASEDEHLAPNTFAGWLWFQARLRQGEGFAEPVQKTPLRGTIVLVSGDDEFLKSFIGGFLFAGFGTRG